MKTLNLFLACAAAALFAAGCSDEKTVAPSSTETAAVTNATNATPPATPSVSVDASDPSKLTATAPQSFKVLFDTTKGQFTVAVTRSLSPNGADRFYNLVQSGFFKDIAFFRVIPGFMAQFGISGDPNIAAKWRDANIPDDAVKGSNTRGAITFADAGPNTRSTQLFINFADNANLDGMGFSPFGKVISGMDVVDKINGEYGEGAPQGNGPDQSRVQSEGNAYLKKDFPNLDYIKSATIVSQDLPAKNDLISNTQ